MTTPTTVAQSLVALEPLARLGLARAAEQLSAMINRGVTIDAPVVAVTPLNEVAALVGGPETCAAGVYLQIVGDLTGHMLLVFPMAQALAIVDDLLGEPLGTTTELGEIEASALAEMGNVTTAGFLNAVAESIGAQLMPSPPAQAVDMAGSLVDGLLAVASDGANDALTIHTRIAIDGHTVDGLFLILPDRQAAPSFLSLARTR